MQFTLKNLLLAFPLFGVAAALLAWEVRITALRAQGYFACGTGSEMPIVSAALMLLAAIAMVTGHRIAAGLLAILPLADLIAIAVRPW